MNAQDFEAAGTDESEFGAGVVVCLAKFSEHLWGHSELAVTELLRVQRGGVVSDDAQRAIDFYVRFHQDKPEYAKGTALEHAIHQAIWLWMNGAADHFFDLDRERSPAALVELADLALSMRSDYGVDRLFNATDYEKVRPLWERSCLELDRALGTSPNWGAY